IREIRQDNKLTYEKFGELLGATKGTVSNWETGKYIPNTKRLETTAVLGNTFVAFLLTGSEAEVDAEYVYNHYYRSALQILFIQDKKEQDWSLKENHQLLLNFVDLLTRSTTTDKNRLKSILSECLIV
ncbi:MAG: helix-turn-helix domain-containing protein, partial [Cetobacterium sp.]